MGHFMTGRTELLIGLLDFQCGTCIVRVFFCGWKANLLVIKWGGYNPLLPALVERSSSNVTPGKRGQGQARRTICVAWMHPQVFELI